MINKFVKIYCTLKLNKIINVDIKDNLIKTLHTNVMIVMYINNVVLIYLGS